MILSRGTFIVPVKGGYKVSYEDSKIDGEDLLLGFYWILYDENWKQIERSETTWNVRVIND